MLEKDFFLENIRSRAQLVENYDDAINEQAQISITAGKCPHIM